MRGVVQIQDVVVLALDRLVRLPRGVVLRKPHDERAALHEARGQADILGEVVQGHVTVLLDGRTV